MAGALEVTERSIQEAIEVIGKHRLGERLDAMDGGQAHQILPEIWPIIQELRLLADACEAGKLQVAS